MLRITAFSVSNRSIKQLVTLRQNNLINNILKPNKVAHKSISFWGSKPIHSAKEIESIAVPIKTIIPESKEIHIPTKKHEKLTGFNAIVGKIPEQVMECSEMLNKFDEYKKIGARLPRGLLMVGPPGTGKTSLAKAIAETANCNWKSFAPTQFESEYQGISAKNLRQAFESLKDESQKTAILFIDEIDSIGSRLQSSRSESSTKILSELLVQMDGCNTGNSNVFVIGATNSPNLLDPALIRPGRFDKIIEVPLPDRESRSDLLTFYLSFTRYDTTSINAEFKEEFVSSSERCSPADIRYIVNEAAIAAVRNQSIAINKNHILEALRRFKERNFNAEQSLKKIHSPQQLFFNKSKVVKEAGLGISPVPHVDVSTIKKM